MRKNGNVSIKPILIFLKKMAETPFQKVCRHWVVLELLSEMEKIDSSLGSDKDFLALCKSFSNNSDGDDDSIATIDDVLTRKGESNE